MHSSMFELADAVELGPEDGLGLNRVARPIWFGLATLLGYLLDLRDQKGWASTFATELQALARKYPTYELLPDVAEGMSMRGSALDQHLRELVQAFPVLQSLAELIDAQSSERRRLQRVEFRNSNVPDSTKYRVFLSRLHTRDDRPKAVLAITMDYGHVLRFLWESSDETDSYVLVAGEFRNCGGEMICAFNAHEERRASASVDHFRLDPEIEIPPSYAPDPD